MLGVKPYITFAGNCREAIDFYKEALGAEELFSQTFGESPMPDMGSPDGIMHATVKVGDSHIMMCDDPRGGAASSPSNISLAIGLDDAEKAKDLFNNLSDGGNVTMPLDKTFWAEAFGMCTDKFGINWMVNCEKAGADQQQAAA
jgi:PhnB protein